MRTKLFTVTIKDCRVETFTVGGNGGSGKDTSNTGVRITHEPSGAVGVGRDQRSQLANKRSAFERMGKSAAFQSWAKRVASGIAAQEPIESIVDRQMQPKNLRVDVRGDDGEWIAE
jgi:protein subunit release factor A